MEQVNRHPGGLFTRRTGHKRMPAYPNASKRLCLVYPSPPAALGRSNHF